MTLAKQSWREIPVALGWFVASVVLMETLENSNGMVTALQPVTSAMLSDTSVFSGWNQSKPFDTPSARALTAIFLLLVPAQIVSVFMVPAESICRQAQERGVSAFATIFVLLGAIPLLVFMWGLSINGPLKIFGKESVWGVAAAIFLVTFSFSYAVRMLPVLLRMRSAKKHNKSD